AAGFAELGSEVWCVDIDAERIARLEAGEVPIHEPGLAEVLAAQRDRLHFTTDLAAATEHARLLFVAVGTPPTYSGDADLSAVHYEPLGAPLVRTDVTSAEMIKLASNAFLATKISFINEIANVCEETGADVNEVARGMGLDPRVGASFLQAGVGFGGSCFPKD